MTQRMNYAAAAPGGMKALGSVYSYVAQSGLPATLIELVYLRVGTKSPAVRKQSAGTDVAFEQLQRAVRAIGDEDFAAMVGDACGYCAFQRICPAQEAGASVVTEERA